MQRLDRRQLVGLLPVDPHEHVPEGSALIIDGPMDGPIDRPQARGRTGTSGHVTSSYVSAALGRTFALGLLTGGRARVGTTVNAQLLDGRLVPMQVTEPIFYDPENTRRDG
jgi:sarcosine oxidase subunit alpha